MATLKLPRIFAVLLFTLNLLVFSAAAFAVMPEEVLKDPALESRARAISQDLRCMVCQNQSIDDSNAPLAKDLRVIVRERLSAGDSDAQVFDYVVARYGNYVLLKPPFEPDTYLLWLAPFLILLIALIAAFNYLRNRPALEDYSASQSKDEMQ
jgi:cytochrome c-type biogenesis protein CcmH